MPDVQTAKSRKPKSSARRKDPAAQSTKAVFKKILCAVDGTRSSTAAVRLASCLAGPDGHLTLLTVTAASGSGANATAAINPNRAKRVLEGAQRIATDAGVSASTVLDPGGPPVKVILERAADHDLLAIGAPAISRLGGMLVGNVASAALGQFSTPMLLVRRSFTGSLRGRRILVASDGQEGSDRIVKMAGKLGLSQDAPVTLVHALGPESQMHPRRIQIQVRALESMLPETGKARIEPGKPWNVILAAVKGTRATMLVIGSRRLGGLRALGSVSRRAAHDAPCSVLLLPPK